MGNFSWIGSNLIETINHFSFITYFWKKWIDVSKLSKLSVLLTIKQDWKRTFKSVRISLMWQILWLFETIRHEKLIEKIEKGYIQTEIWKWSYRKNWCSTAALNKNILIIIKKTRCFKNRKVLPFWNRRRYSNLRNF